MDRGVSEVRHCEQSSRLDELDFNLAGQDLIWVREKRRPRQGHFPGAHEELEVDKCWVGQFAVIVLLLLCDEHGAQFRHSPAIIVLMTDRTTKFTMPGDAPEAVALLVAVRGGDIDLVRSLLSANPDLARTRFAARGGTSTALHFVTDWPGYYPNGPEAVRVLYRRRSRPNALTTGGGSETPGPGSETPLHYAASSDDVDVAAALIDGGADLETPDGSIGTPLDNAVGYSCWQVARLLVMRGAASRQALARWCPRHAGPIGRSAAGARDRPRAVSQGFWHACVGRPTSCGRAAFGAGADLNWEPD